MLNIPKGVATCEELWPYAMSVIHEAKLMRLKTFGTAARVRQETKFEIALRVFEKHRKEVECERV